MSTKVVAILAVVLVAVAGAGAAVVLLGNSNDGDKLVDASGTEVVAYADATSITAASPSLVDLVCYMESPTLLKCVAKSSSNPAMPTGLPQCGKYSDPDTDAISNANSDITLLDASGSKAAAACKTLRDAGMKNVYLFYGSDDGVDGVYKNVEMVGKILGKDTLASEIITKMKDEIANLNSKTANATTRNVIVTTGWGSLAADSSGAFTNLDSVDLKSGVYAAGKDSTLMGLMKSACKVDTVPAGSSWAALDSDMISTQTGSVDAIIILWYTTAPTATECAKFVTKLQNDVAWQNCKAVQDGNVFFFTGSLNSNLSRTTPYTIEDLAICSLFVNPECFSATSGGAALSLSDLPKTVYDSQKEGLTGYTNNSPASA